MIERRAGARIVDRGYLHYEGPRLGLNHAFWVMLRAGWARGMGIRRPSRTKIAPWLLLIGANAPAVIALVLHQLARNSTMHIPSYVDLLSDGGITLLFILFAAVVGPDLLCADRRERVLSLYFASPITRLHYVAARVLSLIALLLGLTLLPMLVLFIGNALLADSAVSYVQNHLHDLVHALAGSFLLAGYYGALAAAVAGFSDRRAFAAGGFLGLLLVSAFPGDIIARGMTFSGHESFILLNLLSLPGRAVRWLFGEQPVPRQPGDIASVNLSGSAYLVAALGVIAISLLLLAWRYRRVES